MITHDEFNDRLAVIFGQALDEDDDQIDDEIEADEDSDG